MSFRMVFGYERWTDFASFAGAGFDPLYPVSMLGNADVRRVARVALDADGTASFTLTLPEPLPVGMLGFVGHNASETGAFRAELFYDTALTSLAYDTAADATLIGGGDFFPVVFTQAAIPIDHPSAMTGRPTRRQIERYESRTRVVWMNGRKPVVRGARVTVSDPNNWSRNPADRTYDDAYPNGYWQCGVFELAQGLQLPVNPARGARTGAPSKSVVRAGMGGALDILRKDKSRVFQGEIKLADRAFVRDRWSAFTRDHDVDVPFLLSKFPDDPKSWLADCYFAHFSDLPLGAHVAPSTDSLSFNVEEWS